jgi:hypothetical protein
MRGHKLHALAVALVVLAAAGSLPLITSSSFSASTTNNGSSFSAVPDWTPPTLTAAAVGKSAGGNAGFVKPGGTYYIYANATDAGAPASGIGTVKADVSLVTTGQTAVALVAGSYSAGGVAYTYRSAQLTAKATLTSGTLAFSVTATDLAAGSTSAAFSVVGDDVVPSAAALESTNVAGGTVGKLELGDTLTLTYSEVMDWTTILAGWDGSATDAVLRLVNAGGTNVDYVELYSPSLVRLPLGTVYLSDRTYIAGATGAYVDFALAGAATATRMTATGSALTFVLGTPGGTVTASTAGAHMTWTPSALATDRAGNAASVTTRTEVGTVDKDF